MTAIRTYAARPASLLTVVLAAAITLALAVSVALMVSDDVSTPSTASSGATAAAASSAPREGVLTPRVTETPSVPSGVRYDGGPEEGSRGIH
jgi:hypothetical protein